MTHETRYYVTTSQQPTEPWPATLGAPMHPFLGGGPVSECSHWSFGPSDHSIVFRRCENGGRDLHQLCTTQPVRSGATFWDVTPTTPKGKIWREASLHLRTTTSPPSHLNIPLFSSFFMVRLLLPIEAHLGNLAKR